MKRRRYRDAIAPVRHPIDPHSPIGRSTEVVEMPEDQWFEIPCGSIMTSDTQDLPVDSG